MFGLISNRRGIILVTSYMMVAVLVVLGSAFVGRSVAEKNASERGRDLKTSFWAAEAGLQRALWILSRPDPTGPNPAEGPRWTTVGTTNVFGEGNYVLEVDDGARWKTVICTGNVGGIKQQVRVKLFLTPPPHPAFNDTLASGGDLHFWGVAAYAYVHKKTQLTGRYYDHGFFAGMGFEDKDEGVAADQTTVTYPDGETDANTTDGDFEDFVDYYRNVASLLPADDVVYMTTDDTVNVHPFSFRGKNLVFVEGTEPGKGNVNILFDAGTWGSDEDLTIVSTGEINYIQPLQGESGQSRLSTISYGNFAEGSIIWSYHHSAIHTQGQAGFMNFASLSSEMKGTTIANQGIGVYSAASLKGFQYCNRLKDGDDVPPGFNLPTGSYTSLGDPTDWQQL